MSLPSSPPLPRMSTENSFLGVFPPPPTPLAAWSRHLVGGPPGFISDERQKRRQERVSPTFCYRPSRAPAEPPPRQLLLGITVSDSDSDSVTVSSRQSQVATSPAASASEPLPPLPASMAVETQPTDEVGRQQIQWGVLELMRCAQDGAETPMPQDTIEGGSQLREEWPQGRAERDTQEDADDESDISDSLVVARMLKVSSTDCIEGVTELIPARVPGDSSATSSSSTACRGAGEFEWTTGEQAGADTSPAGPPPDTSPRNCPTTFASCLPSPEPQAPHRDDHLASYTILPT